jgi:hypothetical protein
MWLNTSMDENTLDTVKFLLRDIRKLTEQFTDLKNGQDTLTTDLEDLENRLIKLEESQLGIGAFPVSNYGFTTEESNAILDLPLSRVIEVYSELPQILESVCRRATVPLNYDRDRPLLERNPLGNYWVLQLRGKKHLFLLPRPGAFARIAALESLQSLFSIEGKVPEVGVQEFMLKEPAKLINIKTNQRWQLEEKGIIKFGEAPLEYQWQKELQGLRDQYQKFNNLLKTVGEAGLESTIAVQRWQQQLELLYGPPVSIIINTCMPMAYAIYKGPMLVPCNLITATNCLVVPAWDRGIPWETSIYAKFHSKHNKNVLRSAPDHPFLPNQPYLVEINWETSHTWAIANNYEDASRIVTSLNGNWGSLAQRRD